MSRHYRKIFYTEIMKKLIILAVLLGSLNTSAQKVENIIIVTTDGLRWQEVFGGVDSSLLHNAKYTQNPEGLYKKFGNENPKVSREMLLPFFWSKVASEGSIFGNRNFGANANIKNQYGFSYPGYNEILTGYPDDSVDSNDKKYNKNLTVLEYLNQKPAFKGKIAAFGTWDVFPYIINDQRSQIPVNAGQMPQKAPLNETQALLNDILKMVPSHASDRNDFVTYFMAREYLKKEQPKVLYIAFDETDEFAHEGNYGQYLHAAHNFDTFLKDLWEYVESNPKYKGKTALVLSTDHGRGDLNKDQWTSHGQKVPDCNQIWMAYMGPNLKNLGEIKKETQVYQNQIAATVAKILGENFKPKAETGLPIVQIFK
jgi:hypothetical protein